MNTETESNVTRLPTKKQLQIPGTERKSVKEIDDAAAEYVDVRDRRVSLSADEKVAKQALIEVMKKHGVSVYRDDEADMVVTVIAGKDGVKVTEAEPEAGPIDEENFT